MAVINNLTKEDIQGKINSLKNPKPVDTLTKPELIFYVHNNQSALYTDSKKFIECSASITELKNMSFDRLYDLAKKIENR